MAQVPSRCPDNPHPRGLFAVMRERFRGFHYSPRTERAYLHWARRFVEFHGRRSPRELGAADVTGFLSSLATRGGVAAATQNQALAAILFLYRRVLELDLPWLTDVVRAKRPVRIPTVLTAAEVAALLDQLKGETALMARLMYGSGLRIGECVALRVKDVDLERGEVIVRAGKGAKDRVTVLPAALVEPLKGQLSYARVVFERDRAHEVPGVELPYALARKYPNAGREWPWQWVFPQDHLSVDPRTRIRRRHHFYEQTLRARSASRRDGPVSQSR